MRTRVLDDLRRRAGASILDCGGMAIRWTTRGNTVRRRSDSHEGAVAWTWALAATRPTVARQNLFALVEVLEV